MQQTKRMAEKDTPYLTGKLLLAMPGLGDPRFHKAVIYMCAHDENGAMGLVINHTLPGLELGQLIGQLDIEDSAKANLESLSTPVLSGGPVESARGFLLHSNDFMQSDTIRIDDTFSVTGTVDALKAVAEGKGPMQMLFILGYAGWSAGQLDEEMRHNAWLTVEPDPALIFHATSDEKWEMAAQKLGIDPAMLSADAGRA